MKFSELLQQYSFPYYSSLPTTTPDLKSPNMILSGLLSQYVFKLLQKNQKLKIKQMSILAIEESNRKILW